METCFCRIPKMAIFPAPNIPSLGVRTRQKHFKLTSLRRSLEFRVLLVRFDLLRPKVNKPRVHSPYSSRVTMYTAVIYCIMLNQSAICILCLSPLSGFRFLLDITPAFKSILIHRGSKNFTPAWPRSGGESEKWLQPEARPLKGMASNSENI